MIALWLAVSLAAAPSPVPALSRSAEAEHLAQIARSRPTDGTALETARRALALTDEFDPTVFVKPGRKGEIVEDAYRVALGDYRRHRARLYEAAGVCADARGDSKTAVRYLRRAAVLDPEHADVTAFARALLHAGLPLPAIDVLSSHAAAGPLGPEAVAVAGTAADVAGLPSVQAELDRSRLLALKPAKLEVHEGRVSFGDRLRLSTGAPLRLDEDGTTILYVASASCRTCSQDLEELRRVLPAGTNVLLAAADPDDDRALRQELALYHVTWPVVTGARAGAFGPKAPAVWVVGRRGWSSAVLAPPFARLPAVVEIFGRGDVEEALPRAKWNGRPAERERLAPQPALTPEGLAPGEDDPAPGSFDDARRLFTAGRFHEALRAIEALAAQPDAWLLSPEARLDRALCLARAGDGAAARKILRGIGDSRFQERVDTALEAK